MSGVWSQARDGLIGPRVQVTRPSKSSTIVVETPFCRRREFVAECALDTCCHHSYPILACNTPDLLFLVLLIHSNYWTTIRTSFTGEKNSFPGGVPMIEFGVCRKRRHVSLALGASLAAIG